MNVKFSVVTVEVVGDGDICPSDIVTFRCTVVSSSESPELRWLCDDSGQVSRLVLCTAQDPQDLMCDFQTFDVNNEGCSDDGHTIISSLSYNATLGENITVFCSDDNDLEKFVSAIVESEFIFVTDYCCKK